MALPANSYLKIIATWPVEEDSVDDPTNYPLNGISLPIENSPLQPAFAILFSQALDPNSYASSGSLSSYIVLTSLTNPSETNVRSFSNILWDGSANLLTFSPTHPLTPASTYLATVLATLKDSSGRSLENTYSWSFDTPSSGTQAPPNPLPLSPADQTLITTNILTLSWSSSSTYIPPSGSTLSFLVSIYSDPDLKTVVWSQTIPASTSYVSSLANGQNLYSVTPYVSPGILVSPNGYYWNIVPKLLDGSNNVQSTGVTSAHFYFYLDISAAYTDDATYPGIREQNPTSAAAAFYVTGCLPEPGYTRKDITAPGDLSYTPFYPYGYY